jgi:hypothetical protein
MELNSWLQSIAQKRWPILPTTLAELRHACARNSDFIDFTDLANLVLSDPFLLFDLIRVIGGSRALQRNESMPSIEQSMMLLGLEPVVTRFASLTPLEAVAGRLHPAVLEDITMWLAHGRVAAGIIKEWLALCNEHRVEDCYIGALIYNLPACFYLLYANRTFERPLLQEVAETFGTSYPKLLEQFAWAVPLPMGLMPVLSTTDGPNKRKQLLRLAVATANGLAQGAWRPQWQVGIEAAARLIGVSYDEAYRVVPNAILHVARNPRAKTYGYPARELIMLPGGFDQAEMRPVAAQDGERDAALRNAVRQIASSLHLKRVLFLRYDKENHCLKLRYQLGLDPSHPLRTSAVGLEPGSFFSVLTSKAQCFHAPPQICAQLRASYTDSFFQLMDASEFAAMSLFDGHELQGVFYVDQGASGTAIDAEVYQQFKELVQPLARQVKHVAQS